MINAAVFDFFLLRTQLKENHIINLQSADVKKKYLLYQ